VTRPGRGGLPGGATPAEIVRALGEPARAQIDLTPPDIEDTPSVANLVRHTSTRSVARMVRHDPGVRLGESPEDVHRFRVATRRYDLQTFAAVPDREWTRALPAELRWLAGLVGVVRDTDVLTERLHTQAATPHHAVLDEHGSQGLGWSRAILDGASVQVRGAL
jgi:hypothetical protein